jgi:hypothetical protein
MAATATGPCTIRRRLPDFHHRDGFTLELAPPHRSCLKENHMPACSSDSTACSSDPQLRRPLRPPHGPGCPPGIGQRRPEHALDALAALPDLRMTAAFGPQHGLRGDKQDNMVESPDFLDPVHGIPVFSLYGTVRRPTPA